MKTCRVGRRAADVSAWLVFMVSQNSILSLPPDESYSRRAMYLICAKQNSMISLKVSVVVVIVDPTTKL